MTRGATTGAVSTRAESCVVMAGHSRPKDGVASLAYVPALSLRRALCSPSRDARVKPAHDGETAVQTNWKPL